MIFLKLKELDIPTASVSVIEYTRDPAGSDAVVSARMDYIGRKPVLGKSTGDKWGG